MIAYFDTSAVIPLLVDEPTSDICARLWNQSSRAVSVRLVYPEARAALARAQRTGRINRSQLASAAAGLDTLLEVVDVVEVSPEVAWSAGTLAQQHGLRGYDAVHLAAALSARDDDLVFVTGDTELATAVKAAGLAVALPGT